MAPPAFTSLGEVSAPSDVPAPSHRILKAEKRTVEKKHSVSSFSSHGGHHRRHNSRTSEYDQIAGVGKRRFGSVDQASKRKVKGPTLMFQAMTTPGKMRLREIDPRRIAFQECASTRVVMDWRKNRWEGANRLIDCLRPSDRMVQYTMKLTGLAKASVVPEDNDLPSSDENGSDNNSDSKSDDDAVVNSDSEDPSGSSSMNSSSVVSSALGSALGSTLGSATTGFGGESASMSGLTREYSHAHRRRNKIKQKITGWLSQYSGCTKGHGERLLRKIYKPRCEDICVKVNSGVRELLITAPPCFCSLQSVNLRNFLLGNRGVQALWPLLKYARAVKSLNLAGNDIHDSGLQYILSLLQADVQNQGKDDVGGLLVFDVSANPITGAMFHQLWQFNDARKDVMMLGLVDTMLPLVKRQRLLRQSLSKFAGAENHQNLEAWRLSRDPVDFCDRELFLQCERIVEATHGSAIHDMTDVTERKKGRHLGWEDDYNGVFNENDNEMNGRNSEKDGFLDGGQDGFLGLDDVPSPRPSVVDAEANHWEEADLADAKCRPCEGISQVPAKQDPSRSLQKQHSRSSSVSPRNSPRNSPSPDKGNSPRNSARNTPSPDKEAPSSARGSLSLLNIPTRSSGNPFADKDPTRKQSAKESWAVRRRKGTAAISKASVLKEASELAQTPKLGKRADRDQRVTLFSHRSRQTQDL